ncbi:MAG: transposase [Candidatus Sericytochromatia bacterium]|nr:transposase [Candidatus Sericytochromatia bacterium]
MSDKPISEVCRDLGVSNSVLYKWTKDMIVDTKSPD